MIFEQFKHSDKCRYCGSDITIVFFTTHKWSSCCCSNCLSPHVFIREPDNTAKLFNYSVLKKINDTTGYRFTYSINDEAVIVEHYVLDGNDQERSTVCIIDKYVKPDELIVRMEALKVFS